MYLPHEVELGTKIKILFSPKYCIWQVQERVGRVIISYCGEKALCSIPDNAVGKEKKRTSNLVRPS
jgi:hypothetical protein